MLLETDHFVKACAYKVTELNWTQLNNLLMWEQTETRSSWVFVVCSRYVLMWVKSSSLGRTLRQCSTLQPNISRSLETTPKSRYDAHLIVVLIVIGSVIYYLLSSRLVLLVLVFVCKINQLGLVDEIILELLDMAHGWSVWILLVIWILLWILDYSGLFTTGRAGVNWDSIVFARWQHRSQWLRSLLASGLTISWTVIYFVIRLIIRGVFVVCSG